MRTTRSIRRLAACGLTALLASLSVPAFAQNSVTFNVRIAITTSCTIAAAAPTDVDFGTVASTATTPVLAQGTITAQCSALTPYSIALNAGANAATAGDVTTRRMRHTDAAVTTNNFVGYQLYQDAGRTNVWGATTATNTVAAVGTGTPQAYNVYGRVLNPSVNNAAAGSYLDTVTATITY